METEARQLSVVKMEHEGPHELSNCKDFLTQLGPIETLLGSVSYNEIDNVDGKTQQLRTSARVFKKMKIDQCNSIALSEKKEKKEDVKMEEPKVEVKKPVNNPLWTSEEKKMFFEALNEYGKDFESIHMYMVTRFKKKGISDDLIKNKNQVRHFYYKTFNMLSSALKFSDQIPKNAKQLYALINYGEIRRKIGSVSKKNWSKLNDLVHNGSIALRIKGKTIRIKTPMCRALRRLNQLDEKFDDLKLPTRVLVELKPKDMVSFLKVQSYAQNPRLKVAVSLQKRLSSVINCISARWKSAEAVVYDKAMISTNPLTRDCIPEKKVIEDNSVLLNPLLRLSPPDDAHVELPSIDISEYFSGQSICLHAYETRKVLKPKEEDIETKTEKSPPSKQNGEHTSSTQPIPEVDSLQTHECKTDITQEEKQRRIAQIREGWTLENCEALTVGEVYLMCGANSKLLLEYNWDCMKMKTHTDEGDCPKQENDLSNPLRKLLSLAKLHCDTKPVVPVIKCTCGHICGTTPKNHSQFKKPLSTKVIKKSQPVVDEGDSGATSQTIDHSEDSNSSMVQLFTQRDTMQRLRNRGRPKCRQFVVERQLVPNNNKSESKHQIVSMDIVAQENIEERAQDGLDTLLKNSTITSPSDGKNFGGLLVDTPSNSNMSTGLSKILKEDANDWISPDVADYSLSSLLGHLDCPSKTNQSISSISHDDTLSKDVDAQLRTLLIETSVDYTAKFADLAAQVIDHKK